MSRMEIHWWLVGLSTLVILISRVPDTESVEPGVEPLSIFDLGPLRCCARPRESNICPGISDYIPCTIASEIERRENRIDGTLATYPSFIEANCTETVRKILCEQNFPTCVINSDDSHEVLLPAGDACKQTLQDVCSIFPLSTIEETCALYEPTSTNYSVGNCSASNITLHHCTVDWYIPEWILQYVKQIDMELGSARSSSLSALDETCWEKFKEVRCKSVGRCWAQDTRLELIISNETCDEAYSCLDDSTRQIYEVILDCNSLPSETDQLVTTPPDVITTERSLATMSRATTAAFIPLILLTLAIS